MAVPFTTRMRAATEVINMLQKKKCPIVSMHVGSRSVVIMLSRKPPMAGNAIKVVGGPDGLYQIYCRRFGIVSVEWRTPYVHDYGQPKRVH